MSKHPYRSELGMILDILEVAKDYGMQGTIITSIARRANLSHYAAIDKCQKLIDSGLMESKVDKKSNIFIVTERGLHFFGELQKVVETAQSIKIRC
jgi:predicted transcriptional regulator